MRRKAQIGKNMDFIYSYFSHNGTAKETNQDSVLIERGMIDDNKFHLFVVCDGMGGLEKGEVASAELIHAFATWFRLELPQIWKNQSEPYIAGAFEVSLKQLLDRENRKIGLYGRSKGIHLGSTVSAILIVNDTYYIVHVGDSRIYEIEESLLQLTKDHTLVAREIELGNMRLEDAELDDRKNVLLQCIGASDYIEPQFSTDKVKENAVYMLCSDGFRHVLEPNELFQYLHPNCLTTTEQITAVCTNLTQTVMNRGEQDNITVLAVRSYREET